LVFVSGFGFGLGDGDGVGVGSAGCIGVVSDGDGVVTGGDVVVSDGDGGVAGSEVVVLLVPVSTGALVLPQKYQASSTAMMRTNIIPQEEPYAPRVPSPRRGSPVRGSI
jgi:hypothetical protein